jgi:hypothetical protein
MKDYDRLQLALPVYRLFRQGTVASVVDNKSDQLNTLWKIDR